MIGWRSRLTCWYYLLLVSWVNLGVRIFQKNGLLMSRNNHFPEKIAFIIIFSSNFPTKIWPNGPFGEKVVLASSPLDLGTSFGRTRCGWKKYQWDPQKYGLFWVFKNPILRTRKLEPLLYIKSELFKRKIPQIKGQMSGTLKFGQWTIDVGIQPITQNRILSNNREVLINTSNVSILGTFPKNERSWMAIATGL